MNVSDLQYQLSFYEDDAEVLFETEQGEELKTFQVRNARYDAEAVVIVEGGQ